MDRMDGVAIPPEIAAANYLKFGHKYVFALIEQYGDDPVPLSAIHGDSSDGNDAVVNAITHLTNTGHLELIERQARVGGRIAGNRYRTHRTPITVADAA